MEPEHINRGIISTKSNIFSLGVIIIEIVTGHRDYPDETEGISSQEFTELVRKLCSTFFREMMLLFFPL
jgi:serine/threonine protein kinase